MAGSPTTIVGFTAATKRPGFYATIDFGTGAQSAGDIPQTCLCVGTMIAAGIAVEDVDVVDIRSPEDADTYFGAGSEVARMCYAALRVAGVQLKATAVAEAVGAAAATATITIGGTWTSSGQLTGWIDGELFSLGVSATDTPTTVAAAIVAIVTNKPRLPVAAANSAGVATLTRKSKGLRGIWGTLFVDASLKPTGMTVAVAGGTSITGGGVHFTGGTGTETASATIANLYAGRYKYLALAQNDLTTLTAATSWRDSNFAKAGSQEGRVQFVITATTDSYANGIAQSRGVNDALFGTLWGYNWRSHPAEIAASFAALRQVTEANDPGASYDGAELPGIVGPYAMADVASGASQDAALGNGLTPLVWTSDSKAVVVRAITTLCLRGGLPFYGTLDVAESAVAVFVRDDLELTWLDRKVANPRSFADPPDGKLQPGVEYPSTWNAAVVHKLRGYAQGVNGSPPLLQNVDNNLPVSGWDRSGKHITALLPLEIATGNHQMGLGIKQRAA